MGGLEDPVGNFKCLEWVIRRRLSVSTQETLMIGDDHDELEACGALTDEGLAGVKDSAFDLVNFYMYLIKVRKPDFIFIMGTESIAVTALDAGARGVVSRLANIFPEFMASFFWTWQEGNSRNTGEH
jgi:dihydrodipicolinate synthase/N-acetylneuraminate lyase